jgi:Domain of unknown function (DUF4232)
MKSAAVLLALTVAVAVAGCSSSRKSATATTTTSAPSGSTSTSSSSSSTSATSSSSVSSSSSVPTGPAFCPSSQLAASLGSPNGAAGTVYYQLTLRNTGTSTCIEQGYPGVSFVGGSDGHQVGAAASRAPGTVTTVTLAPGASAVSTLGIVDAHNFPSDCNVTSVLGLRVYPPDERAALYVPHSDSACANTKYVTMHVGPLAAS